MIQELQSVIKQLLRLPAEEQKRYAMQIEEQLKAEMKWDELFAGTSDDQWDKMIADAKAEIKGGDTESVEDFLNGQ